MNKPAHLRRPKESVMAPAGRVQQLRPYLAVRCPPVSSSPAWEIERKHTMQMLLLPTLVLETFTPAALPDIAELLESGDCQAVVDLLTDIALDDRDPEAFRSLVDWFLVVCLPDTAGAVAAFYEEDEAPRFEEMLTPAELAEVDAFLCSELRAAEGQLFA